MPYILNGMAMVAKLRVPSAPVDLVGTQPKATHNDSVCELTEPLREESGASQSEDLADLFIAGSHRTGRR